jgi:FkbM family methyltransferase
MNTFTYNESFRNELKEDAHSYGEVTFLETHAETGMTALDIGANKGLSTIAMAQKIGSSGTVYAFEPVPEYYRVLQSNISQNAVNNVRAFPCALGMGNGRVDYYKNGAGSGIVPQPDAANLTVDVKTLDVFAEEQGLNGIDLISMDCEGSELLVLQGGEEVLQESSSLKILCEVHRGFLKTLGHSVGQIVSWLEKRRFDVAPIFIDDLGRETNYEECTHIFASRGGKHE